MASKISILLSTRDGYEAEARRHRFLLDAYAGTGGFQGRERQPFAGYWGWSAEAYSRQNLALDLGHDPEAKLNTYLDRFHREDMAKFRRRVGISHYPNYIGPAIDIPLSFMFRKPLQRAPEPGSMAGLQTFLDDANGAGMSWDDMLRDVVTPRAAVVGWCPVLFDIQGEDGAHPPGYIRTALDDMVEGRRPVAVPLFPVNLLDWSVDESGTLAWVKLRHDRSERDDPFKPARQITRITVWRPKDFSWWDVAAGKGGGSRRVIATGKGENAFGEVPIRVMRRKPVPDDPFRGLPMAGNASDEARRLFNALSELDEHMRNCAYALLQVPTKTKTKLSTITAGNGNALPIEPDSQRDYKWLTPDTNVSSMYETRIANTIEEIFRMQHMEFTRASKGGQARSGVSQAFEFEAANRNIANLARQLARFDQAALRLVAKVQVGAPETMTITTQAATRFDVQEMASVLAEAVMATDLGIGSLGAAEVKKRVVAQMLPNVEPSLLQSIYDEIDAMAQLERQDAIDAMGADPARAAENLSDDDDEGDEGGEE